MLILCALICTCKQVFPECIGLKLQNISEWICKIYRVEIAKYVGLNLPNVSEWRIIQSEVMHHG